MLAALLAAGCNGDGLTDTEREAYGEYVLVAVNALPLPFALGRSCGDRAEAGYLQLGQENRFYVEVDVSKPGCPGEATHTWVGTGIWTVTNEDVRLVSDPQTERAVQFGAAPAPVLSTAGNAGAPAWVGVKVADARALVPSLLSACS